MPTSWKQSSSTHFHSHHKHPHTHIHRQPRYACTLYQNEDASHHYIFLAGFLAATMVGNVNAAPGVQKGGFERVREMQHVFCDSNIDAGQNDPSTSSTTISLRVDLYPAWWMPDSAVTRTRAIGRLVPAAKLEVLIGSDNPCRRCCEWCQLLLSLCAALARKAVLHVVATAVRRATRTRTRRVLLVELQPCINAASKLIAEAPRAKAKGRWVGWC